MATKVLNEIREERGYTQEYITEKLGISTASYCYYEKGKRNIPEHIVEQLKVILNIADEEDIFLPATFAIRKK